MVGEVTSNIIAVDVTAYPDATIAADGPVEFCNGGSVNINAVAGYDSYLWSDGSTFSTINVTSEGDYSVTVTENGCSSISSSLFVDVNTTPAVAISYTSSLICYEGSTTLTAIADAASYQWQLNGFDIPGATNSIYNATINGKYTVIASNGICAATSEIVKLKYAERVEISPSGTVALCGPSITMSVPTSPGATYQWLINNTSIAGATSNVYSTTTKGKFHCLVYKDGCTRASKLLTVTECRLADVPFEFVIAPNPASDIVAINYNIQIAGNITINIMDISGGIVMHESKELQAGNYTDELSVNNLASGVYVISIITADGNRSEQKLVVQK